jgi:hypothetical protein
MPSPDSFPVADGIVFLPKIDPPTDPVAAYFLEQVKADISVTRQTLVNAANNVPTAQREHIEAAIEHLNHALYWATKSVT